MLTVLLGTINANKNFIFKSPGKLLRNSCGFCGLKRSDLNFKVEMTVLHKACTKISEIK